MELINKKIKELFGKKELFCSKFGYKYKNFASKLRTMQNYIDRLNNFLKSLNLKVEITEIESKEN